MNTAASTALDAPDTNPAPKIDRDPALQASLRARANHMTFAAIAEEIVKHFPKDRHVSRSTLQRWWKNNRSKP